MSRRDERSGDSHELAHSPHPRPLRAASERLCLPHFIAAARAAGARLADLPSHHAQALRAGAGGGRGRRAALRQDETSPGSHCPCSGDQSGRGDPGDFETNRRAHPPHPSGRDPCAFARAQRGRGAARGPQARLARRLRDARFLGGCGGRPRHDARREPAVPTVAMARDLSTAARERRDDHLRGPCEGDSIARRAGRAGHGDSERGRHRGLRADQGAGYRAAPEPGIGRRSHPRIHRLALWIRGARAPDPGAACHRPRPPGRADRAGRRRTGRRGAQASRGGTRARRARSVPRTSAPRGGPALLLHRRFARLSAALDPADRARDPTQAARGHVSRPALRRLRRWGPPRAGALDAAALSLQAGRCGRSGPESSRAPGATRSLARALSRRTPLRGGATYVAALRGRIYRRVRESVPVTGMTNGMARLADTRPLIAHVVFRFDYGGLENGVANLINGLQEDSFRHAVVALTTVEGLRRRIARTDVAFHSLHKRPGKDPGAYLRLYRLLRSLRPAIVHTRNLGTIEGAVIGRLAGVPYRIHGEHGWDV